MIEKIHIGESGSRLHFWLRCKTLAGQICVSKPGFRSPSAEIKIDCERSWRKVFRLIFAHLTCIRFGEDFGDGIHPVGLDIGMDGSICEPFNIDPVDEMVNITIQWDVIVLCNYKMWDGKKNC